MTPLDRIEAAENTRLREALERIASGHGASTQSGKFWAAREIARAALSEEPGA